MQHHALSPLAVEARSSGPLGKANVDRTVCSLVNCGSLRIAKKRSGTRRPGRPALAVLRRSQRNDGTLGERVKAFKAECWAGSQEKQRAECGSRPSSLVTFFWALQKKVTRLPGRIPGGLLHRQNTTTRKQPTPASYLIDQLISTKAIKTKKQGPKATTCSTTASPLQAPPTSTETSADSSTAERSQYSADTPKPPAAPD